MALSISEQQKLAQMVPDTINEKIMMFRKVASPVLEGTWIKVKRTIYSEPWLHELLNGNFTVDDNHPPREARLREIAALVYRGCLPAHYTLKDEFNQIDFQFIPRVMTDFFAHLLGNDLDFIPRIQ